jgi:hypothetical protein
MMPTFEWIHHILSEGTLAQCRDLVHWLPPHPLKHTVLVLIGSSSPTTRIAAIAALAQQYCYGSDPGVGAPLAAALHALATEIADSETDSPLLRLTLSRLAFAHARALALLGRFDEIVAPPATS